MQITRLLILIFTILAPLCAQTPSRPPSTAEERAKAVEVAKSLEADPLGKHAKDQRSWLIMWLIQVPDIHVKACTNLLGPVAGSKKNYDSELFSQTMASAAAFAIEHPDQAKDDLALYTAGVEGALRAYESILKVKPKARWPYLDDLIEKRNKGELRDAVRQAAAPCSK